MRPYLEYYPDTYPYFNLKYRTSTWTNDHHSLVHSRNLSLFNLLSTAQVMRTYGKNKIGYAKVNRERNQAGRAKLYKERNSTEWDVRIDCDKDYLNDITNNCANSSSLLEYCLVSGLEQPDIVKNGSKDIHTHIAVVCKYAMRRDQVLSLLRGPLKKTDEYCCPRNTKYTYAGWFLHHTKIDWKLVKEKPIAYEFGDLPEDELTEENKKKVRTMFNKFGKDDETYQALWREKFDRYLS